MNSERGIEVVLTPKLLSLHDLEDKIVVVIDVLRATSTICAALHNGAKAVIPVASIEDCLALEGPDRLLAAERKGQMVEGFTYGNSPLTYSKEVIAGKTLVLTTTNGTRAMDNSKSAARIVAGAFANLSLLTEYLANETMDVLLLCAGWRDQFNMEDTLLAGGLVAGLQSELQIRNDAALAASLFYNNARNDLLGAMKQASHYERLSGLGVEEDIKYCLSPDVAPVVPVLQDGSLVRID